ncbi:succinate dehydrogenase hydrophobic membrane anchor subunit [Mycetocola reblochoni]|uniref:Succinate dehydrogenase hydrophobic membrane anchor protein n=2 Tax=Mycetocola reblochoni TaxID=331618 RepID=A0A1R4JIE0_9MICO|nr:succinate dehydrogenase hydrophobic membrane anchor subunit [Mycetocola reblochoni]RLP70525.1 succinate dehydrogenase [Mycetocola reblochoni]SJN31796.1 Succinate dehydrogenase hydrophobic membrane anchor protein [Mycetocola reblochoni REB411]
MSSVPFDDFDSPRSGRHRSRGVNWEKWGWIYMRVSGVILLVLIFGHLFVNLMVGEGVKAIDFAFVGGKLSNPFWQVWDTLMLWLALIHGANGMRTLVNDYARGARSRAILKGSIFAAAAILIVLGTLVVFTFDPCPPVSAADAHLLPSFCPAP